MIENAAFLWALPALLLPFVLRLIRSRRPRELRFSQMALLESVLRRANPVRRRSPWLLYLVRMLTLLLLILIVAGWLLPPLDRGAATGTLFLVDDTCHARSHTEAGGRLWEAHVARIKGLCAAMAPGSSAGLLGLSGRSLPWATPAELVDDLKALQPGYNGDNWPLVRREFMRLLRARRQENLRLVVVGDGTVGDAAGAASFLGGLPAQVSLSREDETASLRANLVLEAKVREADDGVSVTGRVHAPGLERVRVQAVSATGGSQGVDVELNSGSGAFTMGLGGAEFRTGRVFVEAADRHDFDNQHFYSTGPWERLRVVNLGHQQAEQRLKDVGTYIDKGFTSLAKRLPLQYQSRNPRHWTGVSREGEGVVLLHDPPFLSAEEAAALSNFVRQGGRLLLMPGPFTPVDMLEARLGDILPARLKEPQAGSFRLKGEEPWSGQLPRFMATDFRGRWLFYRADPEAKTRLRFADGSPFWLTLPVGRGEVHLISSPFHMVWSDAVVLADFPRLLREMLHVAVPEWTGNAGDLPGLQPGRPIPAHFTSIRQELGQAFKDRNSPEPGLYSCGLRDGRQQLLPCNFDPAQLQPRVSLDAGIRQGEAVAALSTGALARFDKWLVLLLGLCLLAEALILGRRTAARPEPKKIPAGQ